uniref:Uncharacterized protein n=1 Tax=Rhodnius prolixus TaxID=13249 RepID=T1I196_RHOPR
MEEHVAGGNLLIPTADNLPTISKLFPILVTMLGIYSSAQPCYDECFHEFTAEPVAVEAVAVVTVAVTAEQVAVEAVAVVTVAVTAEPVAVEAVAVVTVAVTTEAVAVKAAAVAEAAGAAVRGSSCISSRTSGSSSRCNSGSTTEAVAVKAAAGAAVKRQ